MPASRPSPHVTRPSRMPRGRRAVLLTLAALFAVGGCEPSADTPGVRRPRRATRRPPQHRPPPPRRQRARIRQRLAGPCAAPAARLRGCPGARHCDGCAGDAAGQGRAAKTGYEREVFGQAWADVDRNGCDTRNDILRQDLTAYVLKAGTRGCLVLRGSLRDPTPAPRSPLSAARALLHWVQIDHVVALSDAWQKGAQQLSFARRAAFRQRPPQPAGRRRPEQPAQGRR